MSPVSQTGRWSSSAAFVCASSCLVSAVARQDGAGALPLLWAQVHGGRVFFFHPYALTLEKINLFGRRSRRRAPSRRSCSTRLRDPARSRRRCAGPRSRVRSPSAQARPSICHPEAKLRRPCP